MKDYIGSGGKPKEPKRTEDTLYSQDIIEMVLSFGEGAVEGLHDGFRSFYIGEEPLVKSSGSDTVDYNFPDFCVSMRQGYEDDEPIEFLLGGEAQVVAGSARPLNPLIAQNITVTSVAGDPVRFIDIRLVIASLYSGSADGSVYTSSIELEIKYRPEGTTVWQYVTTSFLMQMYRGVHLQTALKRMTTSERAAFELMDEAAKNEIIRKKLLIVSDGTNAVTSGGDIGKAAPNGYLEKDIVTESVENSFTAGSSTTNPKAYVITGKTTSGYVHEIGIPVPPIAGNWEVEIVRKTAEVTDDYSSKEIAIDSVAKIGSAKVSYPRVALAHIVAQHTDRFSAIPDISCVLDGILCDVPVNYNPRTRVYDGVWLGNFKKAWTNNPVWVLRELIMNPDWGDRSREPSIGVNNSSFYEAAQFCDELIPTFNPTDGESYIPRHTLNMVLQEYKPSDEVKRFIAGNFRAVLSEKNGQYSLYIDKEREPTFFVCPEMVLTDGFQYSTTDLSSRYNYMKVRYQNADTNYKEDTRLITDPASIALNGIISTDITAVGCTNLDEALRLAAYSMLTNKYETIMVSFKIPRLPLYISQYENFLLADRVCGWGDSGRVTQTTENSFELMNPTVGAIGDIYTVYFFNTLGLQQTQVEKVSLYGYVRHEDTTNFLSIPLNTCVLFANEGIGAPKQFRTLMAKDEGVGNAHVYTLEASEVFQPKYQLVDNLNPETSGFSFTTTKLVLKDRYNVPSPLTVTVGLGDLTNTLSGLNYEIDISVDHIDGNVYEVVWYAEGLSRSQGYRQILAGGSEGVRGLLSPAYPVRSTLINFEVTVIDPNGNRGATFYLLNQNPKPVQTLIEEVKLSDRMVYDFYDSTLKVAWLNPEDMDIFQYHRLEMFKNYDSGTHTFSGEVLPVPVPFYSQENEYLLEPTITISSKESLRTNDTVGLFVNLYYRRYYQSRESLVKLQIDKFLQPDPLAPTFDVDLDLYGNEFIYVQYDWANMSLASFSGVTDNWTDSSFRVRHEHQSPDVTYIAEYYNAQNYDRPVHKYVHLVVTVQPVNHTQFEGVIVFARKVGQSSFVPMTPKITNLVAQPAGSDNTSLNNGFASGAATLYLRGIIFGEGAGDYEVYFYYVGKDTGANSRMPDVRTAVRTITLT